jgi:hypothetical protein
VNVVKKILLEYKHEAHLDNDCAKEIVEAVLAHIGRR